jgi:RHS repeat-associated protein
MEEVHALIEENNFDNVDETRDDLPQNYPVDGSAQLNLKIAELIADGEMVMGPSKVLNVRRGEKITASVEYFYEEDAPGATYDNLGFFVNEILVAFASSAAGVVPVGDGALFNIASGNTPLAGQLEQFLSTRIDTNDLSKPQAYLVYLAYDLGGQLNASNSGAIQVDEANQLRTILTSEITADKAGFMHIYVSNGSSAKGVSFNDFLITSVTGKTRQINHYYPYGLPIGGLDENEHKYLNKYTGKEHQTGEYMDRDIDQRGLEMFDFEARFWEPQLARWTSPDPAMQFSNPYLGIGNNPVMYVDPDGEFILIAAGVLVGAYIGGAMANDHMNPGKWDYQSANTWIGMGVGGAIGAFGGHALSAAKGKAIMTFGKTMSKTAGKKFFGSTVGGMTNSITNYGGADDFGWGTLGDFGAGFGGAYAGISTGSKIAGFNAGGFLNSVNNIAQDGFGTPYEFAQDWIGGGLSSMVGMSYGMPKPAAPVGQKATLKSFGKSFVKYSGQSAMWDFAYTKQEDFAKRNFGDFAMLYGVGGVMGASVDMLKFMTPNAELGQNAMRANKFFRTGMNAAISLVELRMTSQLKGKPGKPKAQPNKAGVLGEKWSFNFLNYY